MNVLPPAPTAELPAEWSWCPDCSGTGLLDTDPADPAPAVAEECWTCRGLGAGARHVL